MTLKDRFLEAVSKGSLGDKDDFGTTVTLKQFKAFFKDVKSDYINSFLPAAVIENGQYTSTHTKYLFRIKKGVYRVHPDAIQQHQNPEAEMPAYQKAANLKSAETQFFYKNMHV